MFIVKTTTTSFSSQYPYAKWLFEFPNAIQQLQETADKNQCTVNDVLTFLRTLDETTLQDLIEQLKNQSSSTVDDINEWLSIPYSMPGNDYKDIFLCKKTLFKSQSIIDQMGSMNESTCYVSTKHWPYVTMEKTTYLNIPVNKHKILCKM
jgi:hypothetical protein